jgi:regulator of RNase E activity RraA
VVETPDIVRPSVELSAALAAISSATASAELSRMGIRSAFIRGPVSVTPGVRVAGPALLQFLPKREDLYPVDEYAEPEKQLHRHVMYHAQPGDMIVVDARGDTESGVFGEMMLTHFKGRGGAGVVVDGCLRDIGEAKQLGLGLWIRGATPNFHAHTDIVPAAVNVPVTCGGTLVEPGDIVVADDDGAVVVPVKLAPTLVAVAQEHAEWEEFSRIRLAEGGDLRLYYPLSEDAWCSNARKFSVAAARCTHAIPTRLGPLPTRGRLPGDHPLQLPAGRRPARPLSRRVLARP